MQPIIARLTIQYGRHALSAAPQERVFASIRNSTSSFGMPGEAARFAGGSRASAPPIAKRRAGAPNAGAGRDAPGSRPRRHRACAPAGDPVNLPQHVFRIRAGLLRYIADDVAGMLNHLIHPHRKIHCAAHDADGTQFG
jgi:hypothetical protein